jgi:hypothetical protein
MSQVLRESANGLTTPPVGLSEEVEGMLRSISVCNKALLWQKKTNSDWLSLVPQWVDLAPKWVGLCPPRPTYGCTPAQSCVIHRVGPNSFFSISIRRM